MKVGDRVRIRPSLRRTYNLEDAPATIIEVIPGEQTFVVSCLGARFEEGKISLFFTKQDLTLEPPNYGFGKWFKEHNHDR